MYLYPVSSEKSCCFVHQKV